MAEAITERLTGAEDVLWDLSVYYDSIEDPRIESDMAALEGQAEAFAARYRERVAGLDAAELLEAVQTLEALYDKQGRLGNFISLNHATQTGDARVGALLQKYMESSARVGQLLVFFELEWNLVDDAAAEARLKSPLLGRYAYYLRSERRYRPYQLSEIEEQLLMEKNVTGTSAWTRFFTQLMSAARYEFDGESLNQTQLLARMRDADRDVRARAADALTAGLRENAMQTTYIFNVLAADKAANDKRRGYPSWIAARNLSNKSPDAVVDALIAAVTGQYALVERHYTLKRKLMEVDALYDYDRYAPLDLKESESFYTWDEAKAIILDAMGRFSPRMAEVAGRFFDERWIHAPVLPDKRGGAFASYGTPSSHPWVFVNYQGKADDVMTLAHELGHGIHMYLAAEKQGLFGMGTPLTTAEMASTFAEMVVFQDLMARESDPEVRLAMLVEKIEGVFATVFRQVSMNRFEDSYHTARREQGELSTDAISDLWLTTQKAMFGDSVTLRDAYGIWWSYVPHFLHTPGYVYAYAFGELLVLALYRLYEQEGARFIPQYIDLLAAGDSDDPHNLLAAVGIDLLDPAFWDKGLDAIAQLIDQEMALATTLYPARLG
jgi:oligoendopeptidase F